METAVPILADIAGRELGSLTAVGDTGRREPRSGNAVWTWRCACGRTRDAAAYRLVRVAAPRCGRGCPLAPTRPPKSKPPAAVRRHLSPGAKYGRLTPSGPVDPTLANGLWHFACACGNECVLPGRRVLSGRRESCGCLSRAATAANGRLAATRPGAGLATAARATASRLDPTRLKAARLARGLTMSRLATAAGVSTASVHGYERPPGRYVPAVVAGRIADSLGVVLADLT